MVSNTVIVRAIAQSSVQCVIDFLNNFQLVRTPLLLLNTPMYVAPINREQMMARGVREEPLRGNVHTFR